MSLTSWALFIYYKLLKILSQSFSFFIFIFFCSLSLKFLFEASLLEILFLWNSFSKLRFSKFLLLLLLWVSVHELYIFVLFWSCVQAALLNFSKLFEYSFFFRSCVQAAPLNQTIDSQHDQFLAVYRGGQPPTRHATIFQACGHHHNAMRYCPRIFALVVAATWITSIASWFSSSRTATALPRK